MEIEPSPPVAAKKLWNIVRIMLLMIRKSVSNSKSKLMLDLHVLLTRGKLAAAGKAIGRHSALSCRSNDVALSFICPKEYEFSCSNSPAYFHVSKRKHHQQHLHHLAKASRYDDAATISAVQKLLDMLNVTDTAEASPATRYFPGFGRSPMVRPLRITDSPFPLKDGEADVDSHVDVAAEEFINNFYKDLKSQKKKSAAVMDSPYHDMIWGR